MKRRFFTFAIVATLASSMLFTSCIGSFGLSGKLLSWNKNIDSKFVNALVFFVLSPVYAVTMTVDLLVINSIEFWSGKNPMEAGIITKIQGKDGVYTVETLENGYNIKNENGEGMNFIYDFETSVWSAVTENETINLVKLEEGNQEAIVYLPYGGEKSVELSQSGILAFEQYMNEGTYLAAN